jgi:hypothetical protein
VSGFQVLRLRLRVRAGVKLSYNLIIRWFGGRAGAGTGRGILNDYVYVITNKFV